MIVIESSSGKWVLMKLSAAALKRKALMVLSLVIALLIISVSLRFAPFWRKTTIPLLATAKQLLGHLFYYDFVTVG
jgi:hypothetical protein